jgi:hypothetical protein
LLAILKSARWASAVRSFRSRSTGQPPEIRLRLSGGKQTLVSQ